MNYEEKYEKIKDIGGGEFGNVILEKNKEDGTKVIIKVVDFSKIKMDMQQKIMHEGQIMLTLKNENIVQFYSFNSDNTKGILITEFSEGGNLS